MKLKGIQLLGLLCLNLFCYGQNNAQLDRIKLATIKVMEAENIPAISIGIVTEGTNVHFINLGHKDRTKQQAVNEESNYQLASLGKTFIGLIAHHLLLNKTIRLDQPITEILPFSFSKRRQKKLKKITIEHLLHHRSGFPQDAKAGYKRIDGNAYNYAYTVDNLEKDLCRLNIKSGNKFQYSNFGYAVLAYILEQATNSTYNDLLEKYLIKPYSLENTTMQLSQEQQSRLVTPYRKDNRAIATQPWIMGKLAPPSAAYSTTKDLTKLLIAQLKAYRQFEVDQKIIPLYLSQNTRGSWKNSQINYGYGFFDFGNATYGHGGDMDGFACDYSISPQQNFGIVLLTSSGEKWVSPLVIKINQILGE